MIDDVKARLIAATPDPDDRAALEPIDAAYFTVAAATVSDPADRAAVLARVAALLTEHVTCVTRRADAAEARLAASRRHLHVVPSPAAEPAQAHPHRRSVP